MRVALNVEQLLQRSPGGIGRYTAELARGLPTAHGDAQPFDVVAFVARHGRGAVARGLETFGLGDLEPVRMLLPRPLLYDTWHLVGYPPLGAFHRELRDIDLVHAPSLAVPPKGGVPLVVSMHDAAPFLHPGAFTRRGRSFHQRGARAAARRADVVIAPSAAAAAEIVAATSIPSDRIRVVPQGVTPRAVEEDSIIAARRTFGLGDAPYVLWVGTFEPRKNLPVIVDAFRAVVAEHDLPHNLVLTGPVGWLEAEATVNEHTAMLGDRVRTTGAVGAAQLDSLYRGADLFVFPSVNEGFGIPILEAMSQSTAVVCSDIPVFHEVAGDAARFAPPNDPDAWSHAMITLLRDTGAREHLERVGRERVAGFTWERCVEGTRAVYREVLGV